MEKQKFEDENSRLLEFMLSFLIGFAKSRGWSKKDLKDYVEGSWGMAPDLPKKAPNLADIMGVTEFKS